jgi:predicted membrane-bound spermidine synthase
MAPAPLLHRLGVLRAALVVSIASCATLVLELVADRLLAPFIGVSLHTWTSIIGVILAGISLGSWAGGRLADRAPSSRWVAGMLAAGALCSLLTLGFIRLLGDGVALHRVPLLPRAFLLSLLAFFPPSFTLAMVTPVTLKLLLKDLSRGGRTVGLLQALGTLGSIAGTFLTGFVLVSHFEVPTIVCAVAAALGLTALLCLPDSRASEPPPISQPLPEPAEATGHREGFWVLQGNEPLACGVVAGTSFCMMMMELVASRMLAPTFGVSLLSWTGIFAVVLTGIAVGNYVGGHLADRWPRQENFAGWLLAAGLSCLVSALVNRVLVRTETFAEHGLVAQVVLHTSVVFFPPVVLLGTLSPQLTRLALTDLGHAGRTAGRISAWATAGALAGTFFTGWLLISWVGVYALVLLASVGLVGLAAVLGRVHHRRRFGMAVSGVVGFGVVLTYLGGFASPCSVETDYYCILVRQVHYQGEPLKELRLDRLTHSITKVDDPNYLLYPHWRTQTELVRLAASRTPSPRVLVIGGGGYTMPRWVEAFVPSAQVEVVEIDPAVTQVALKEFGVRQDTRIRSFNLDGRQYLQELAEPGAYDMIIQDAVNDLSVPYHLMTREYDARVRQLLKPDGLYLLTLIDDFSQGQFLHAAVATMRESFPSVQVLISSKTTMEGHGLFVVAGSSRPLDMEEVGKVLAEQGVGPIRTRALSPEELGKLLAGSPPLVLTDRYAPVDDLMRPLFMSLNQGGN